ncbi:MAG: YckD family protein [Deltaproteobacteria bacterium]|nr:YckD family protein [Deltaproteobacteria bacterium]
MDKAHKDVLQITKEIVVKFVEVGRITPANFAESFPAIYAVVRETLAGGPETTPASGAPGSSAPDAFLLASAPGRTGKS